MEMCVKVQLLSQSQGPCDWFCDSRTGSIWGAHPKRLCPKDETVPRQHYVKDGDGGELGGLAAVPVSPFFPHSAFEGGGTEAVSGEAM